MKTGSDTNFIMIFAGTSWEAGVVKTLLENAEIETFIKNEKTATTDAWIPAPGGIDLVKVFVSSLSVKKAGKIVNRFKKNPNISGE